MGELFGTRIAPLFKGNCHVVTEGPRAGEEFLQRIFIAIVISKKNRHYLKHSKQPFRQRKQDKSCLSGAY